MHRKTGGLLFVQHDGREAGPYTEQEIRDRLAAGTLRYDDLAWSDGAATRTALAELFPESLTTTARPRRGLFWAVISLLFVGYLASPYFALYRLGGAIASGDREALESSIDFPAVRSTLKEDLRAHMAASAAEKKTSKEDPFAALGAVFATALIDPILDSVVTPAGIAALIQQEKNNASEHRATDGKKFEMDWSKVRYAFFTSPRKFLVDFDGTRLRLRFTGFGWRLYRIEASPEMLVGM